ncbi:ATP-dependent DNA ligase [Candidatus Gottesmanbacteria bacterium]|nr:ATP-dependent DNA ligase [Candidatus Gottesmanbacteria bacterium]
MTFSELSVYFQKLESTPSRNTMTEILADLFRSAQEEEIGKICYLLLGRVAPLYDPIEFGVADKFMIRAIAKAYGATEEVVKDLFKRLGDLGSAAQEVKSQKSKVKNIDQKLKVEEVYKKLYAITQESGEGSQEKKIEALANLLASVDALSARYIARIPLDKLRLGFSDMTILDALSWMLNGDKSERVRLEDAYNVRPDIGFIAETVRVHRVAGLSRVHMKLGVPVLASLCQRLPSADEMIKKMGEVAVEPKWDGVRVQIHYQNSKLKTQKLKVKTFSRNLENTTVMFPELQDVGDQLRAKEIILDSEAVGMDPVTGNLIPFQETMTRKRKHDIEETRAQVPLKFFVFDVLYKDGKELLNAPLSERRVILEDTVQKGSILSVSPQIVTSRSDAIREYHDAQIAKGLEGVVVKKWVSPYEPGRRGYSWVKFKEEEGKTGKLTDTIDAVVMGYTRGQGKRTAFGVGQMLLGVRDGDEYVTITKLGSGTTEAELVSLSKTLQAICVKEKPAQYRNVHKNFMPDVWVSPRIVLEIAGDDLTRSPTHGAGVAVRFPRLVRIREDKSAESATTKQEIETMYRQQTAGSHA